MNYLQKQASRKALNDLISHTYPEGCCKCTSETKEHYLAKAAIVHWLKNNGYDVYTEASFRAYGRADIIALHSNGYAYIIEVLCSEKEKTFESKVGKYPNLTVVKVYTKDFDYDTFEL